MNNNNNNNNNKEEEYGKTHDAIELDGKQVVFFAGPQHSSEEGVEYFFHHWIHPFHYGFLIFQPKFDANNGFWFKYAPSRCWIRIHLHLSRVN